MLAIAKPPGVIKVAPEDFVVREVQVDGSVPEVFFKTQMRPYDPSSTHTAFLLCKHEVGAEGAYTQVARQLDVARAQVTDYGRKDHFAVTVQRIVVEGEYKHSFQHESMWLRHLGPANVALRHGGHQGNRFSVLVRTEASVPPEGEKFLNLFGPQRFGDGSPEVGKYLLEGEYDQALQLLQQSPMNRSELQRIARRYGISAMKAMLHLDFRSTLHFKVVQWQSHLWNMRAKQLQLKGVSEGALPVWGEAYMDEYEHLWNPTMLNDEFVGALHSFTRSLYVRAQEHVIVEEDDGFRHKFTLRSGSYATVFLSSLYDLTDESRRGLDSVV